MQNLSCIVAYHARTRPDAEALVFGSSRLSWSDLHARVQAVAAGLAGSGVSEGTIVALVMKNSSAFIELLYAISHLGAVALPVNYRLSADEVAYILDHAGAELVLADEELSDRMAKSSQRAVLLDARAQADARSAFPDDAARAGANRRTGKDLLRLMYTSGTTARPKGVMHSYDNFYWKCFDHIVALELQAKDRLCVAGPLYHVGACDLPGLGIHIVGGAMVVMREFDAAQVMATIQQERITGIWLAPVMTNAVLALNGVEGFDCGALKWCIGGGERTPESRIRRFMQVFPNARYIDAYGMTETLSGDTFMQSGYEVQKIGSVGRPVAMLELEVRDDHGKAVRAGIEGEICMRGPKVTAGYWKDATRTGDAMWPDGFLRSGDIGLLDADGFLFLTDRKKDMILSGGENISSSEVERVLYEMPEIRDAAVIARPDEKWGETPVAFVVLNQGMSLGFARLDRFCREHLAGFKCPKQLYVMDELPRNPSGKILKRILRENFQ